MNLYNLPETVNNLVLPERGIPLTAMITVSGHQTISSYDYHWNGLNRGRHELIVWQYTLSGRGCLEYEDKQYDLLPGTGMLVYIPHAHRYYYPANNQAPWSFIFVCMNGREAIRICRELINRCGPVLRFSAEGEAVQVALDIIMQMHNHELISAYAASAQAYQQCMAMATEHTAKVNFQGNYSKQIEQAVSYCLKHFSAPLSTETLSDYVGYSRAHFARLFKAQVGEGPAVFLARLRLRKATNLLQTSTLNIDEIAERCGYQSTSYFCRAFKKAFSTSPAAFRRNSS